MNFTEVKQIVSWLDEVEQKSGNAVPNPMIGRNCLARTYSAGVHWGLVKSVQGTQVHLTNSIRIWNWTGGGLSLSAIANEGMQGGKTDRTNEVYLTEVIELIPTSTKAEKTYEQFLQS